jgi:shikimate kinase
MAFEQATIRIEKEPEFGGLKSALERTFATDRAVKYLKALDSRNIRIRSLDAVLAANVIDGITGAKAGTARSLYEALTVSDQAQMREFYLSKIEEVEPALRAKFSKLYQYY